MRQIDLVRIGSDYRECFIIINLKRTCILCLHGTVDYRNELFLCKNDNSQELRTEVDQLTARAE